GEEQAVLAAIEALIPPSRAEEGCRFYQPNRDPENPRVFFFYEIYDDEAAYKAHGESAHFAELGFGDAIPRLEGRERMFYETIDASAERGVVR
nr:antibiotic biosynthesis monooxygenase [Actinomycetota bacterium]